MKIYNSKMLLLMLLVPSLVLSSCTLARQCEIGAQSHFVPPNSNVKTLGPVAVNIRSGARFLTADIKTGKDDLDVYNRALAQVAESNVIVDYRRVTSLKYILLPLITWKETELNGTAAKIVMGRQRLDGSPRADSPVASSPAAVKAEKVEQAKEPSGDDSKE